MAEKHTHRRQCCPNCSSIYFKKVKEYTCRGKKVNIHYNCKKCNKSFLIPASTEFAGRGQIGFHLIRILKAKKEKQAIEVN